MAVKDYIVTEEDDFLNIDNRVKLPCIPLRGLVVFPNDVINFDVGRKVSLAAVDTAMNSDRSVFLVAQKFDSVEEPDKNDLYDIGVICKIRQILKLQDNCMRVLVEGVSKANVISFEHFKAGIFATVSVMQDKPSRVKAAYKEALIRKVQKTFEGYATFIPKMPKDIKETVIAASDPAFLADYITANIPIPVDDKQYVLEQQNPVKRLETVLDILKRELEICRIDAKINDKTRKHIDENQREFYLREQLKTINSELYGEEEPDKEITEYYQRTDSIVASEQVKEILNKEISKLSKMPYGSQEATVVRAYLDTCLALPFGKKDKLQLNVKKAENILNKEHYGLEKVKQQILDTIAVYSLNPNAKGRIMCLSGPPGVGKTSIVRSLAKCMGRSFERISLGGIHDEAEIRGHRKTYIGAMPGKIIKAITVAGSLNPLILLDEIDKVGADYKGDPASALLETLDAEQNSTFVDHYIDFPFDLSDVFFVTTANNPENIPAPLLDRMDIIEIPGYTREDKFQIAKKHLIKKQMEKNGLSYKNIKIENSVIRDIIDYYTREAGVRNLERTLGSLCRKAARKIAEGDIEKVHITSKNIEEFLGVKKFRPEEILPSSEVGIINGLAWTSVGGEIMQLEVVTMEGSGKVELTGSLGDVMKESAQTAVTWVRTNAERFSIPSDFYKAMDIHIHATEAAVPKDGPSAGVTIATGIISALTGVAVKNTVAMTGEITVRGRVLAIGGLNEKTMAAYRAGVKTVIIPKQNEADLQEIDPVVRANLKFITVEKAEDVLNAALVDNNWLKTSSVLPVYTDTKIKSAHQSATIQSGKI